MATVAKLYEELYRLEVDYMNKRLAIMAKIKDEKECPQPKMVECWHCEVYIPEESAYVRGIHFGDDNALKYCNFCSKKCYNDYVDDYGN